MQFRKRQDQVFDPAAQRAHMRDAVRNGIDVGTEQWHQHTSVRAQIQRIGKDGIRRAARAAGYPPPSDRTIRRWAQHDRVPHERVSEAVRRADRVTRMGGVHAAAQRAGRATKTITEWLSNPDRNMGSDALEAVDEVETEQRRSAAGIPLTTSGQIARPAKLTASGVANVKGTSTSSTYEHRRNIRLLELDIDTTNSIVTAMERGDPDAAQSAIESYLSTNHAQCEDGYTEDAGWHFMDLNTFEITW